MIEKDSEWERIVTENVIQFDDEVGNRFLNKLYIKMYFNHR